MGSTPKEEMGECQAKFCSNDAKMNLQLWEDGFVEDDIELCRSCGRGAFNQALDGFQIQR